MDTVYRGGCVGEGGGGWKAEGGLNHSWAQGRSHCVFSKTQKQPKCTCQAKMVTGSSGIIWTVMNLQGQKNAACESRPGYL